MLRLSIGFVMVGVVFTVNSPAECGVIRVIDQENDPPLPASIGSIRFADQTIAQEFWPTFSSIDAVELRMIDRGIGDTAGAEVFVRIRWFSLTGPIVGTSHLVSLPNLFGTTGDGDVVSFTFPSHVVFSPDQPYFIEVNELRGDNFHVALTGFNYYEKGRLWQGYPAAIPQESEDLWFRTGIVPEPGTKSLVVVSFCAFVVVARPCRRGRRR